MAELQRSAAADSSKPLARAGRARGINSAITVAHASGFSSMPHNTSPDRAFTIPVTKGSDRICSMLPWIPLMHSSQVTALAINLTGVDFNHVITFTLGF
jgi:hypothetical protein